MNENDCRLGEELFRLVRLLVHSGKITETRLDGSLGSTCLSSTRLMSLRHIGQPEQPLSLGQLAAQMAFVKSNVTHLVDRLEAEHLVQRVPDPNDRRCTLVTLTDEGRRQYEAGLQILQPLETELQSLYTPAERRQLIDLLERLSTAWA
ncbi:MAG: MarR family winged helix-turn-helix transcriptional regulator [Aggregatilineales bacterium]